MRGKAKRRIRIESILIKGLKNVEYGKLDVNVKGKRSSASVLGLYGQNGSGKTTVINALQILKACLIGDSISELEHCINANTNSAEVVYQISLSTEAGDRTDAWYTLSLAVVEENAHRRLVLVSEQLQLSHRRGSECVERKGVVIDTATRDGVFVPVSKYDALVGPSEDTLFDLEVEKRLAYRESRSFVFSEVLIRKIWENVYQNQDAQESDGRACCDALSALRDYGFGGLFVLLPSDVGLVTIGALPLRFRVASSKGLVSGMVTLNMNGTQEIQDQAYSFITAAIKNIDIVLDQIIPGLTVKLRRLETLIGEGGETMHRVQLVSNRGDTEIPLEYESDGIKRIVSFVHLLALMYNDPEVTVAIDELDSGVFEYLLGEITRVVSESGKGQLIFTSHNLRPLETIDKHFVAFTTTNPQQRYIRLKGARDAHNLRRFYYHDLQLGGQDEELYDSTSNGKIKLAFMKAGAEYAE